jgi:arylsulfatase A-like enzyme
MAGRHFLNQVAVIVLGWASSVSAASDVTRHVVVVVWDGMRPDFVSEQNTPVLWKLARDGTIFRNHHAVYPSATEVNGVALTTGVYPDRNGIIANYEFRPEIDKTGVIHSEDRIAVRKGDELSGGKYVALPTIAESARAAGLTSFVSVAKPVGLLLDRHELVSLGKAAWVLGPFGGFATSDKAPAAERDRQATAALTDSLSRKNHARERTDILVVSDHGFSTIQRSVDLRKILKDAAFDVATQFTSEPRPGQIMLVGQGGSVLFYVIGHDAAVIRRLVGFLQQSDFAGPIFTKAPVEGTFGFDQARIDSPHAPDIEMAFRWNDGKSQFGVAGMIDADWNRKAGQGTHATLGRFDMHNLLIAAGPDFQSGRTDDLPSGNVDLAPTIYRVFAITSPQELDGRVLSESMANIDIGAPQTETKTVEARREFPAGKWRQTLKISRARSTIYLDEGNGAFEPKR